MKASHYATHDVVVVEPSASIDRAIALMEEFHIHHLPVVDGGSVLGMVSDRDILLSVAWKLQAERTVAEPAAHTWEEDDPEACERRVLGAQRVDQIMTRPVVTIKSDTPASRAARIMLEREIHALPLVWHDRIVGIVSDVDLLKHVLNGETGCSDAETFLRQPVSECMRMRVSTVDPSASVIEIIDVCRRRHVRHVPVVLDGSLLGIVSDRDARRGLGEAMLADMQTDQTGEVYAATPCALDMMTRDVKTVHPHAAVATAIQAMLTHGIHALPVTVDGSLRGMIADRDVLRAVVKAEVL